MESSSTSTSSLDVIRDEMHLNISSSARNYFDNGVENSCPILFKISGHDDYCYGKFNIRVMFFFYCYLLIYKKKKLLFFFNFITLISFKKPFPFYQNTYSFFYINSNGFVSFSYFDPSSILKFPVSAVSLIAPFWSDIDLRFAGNIFHKEINETDSLIQIIADVKKRCPSLSYR